MKRAERLGVIEGGNHPLDLPPVTKTLDVAGVAAVARPRRRFERRKLAILLDEFRCVSQRMAAVDVGKVHERALTRESVVGSRIDRVKNRFTTCLRWRAPPASAKAGP